MKTLLAVIREEDCIGCTKCIDACPVDVIIGAHKQLHTVLSAECIGCQLCIPPCPVDCIDLIEQPVELSLLEKKQRARLLQTRYTAKKIRARQYVEQPVAANNPKDYIQAAILRAKLKNKS